MSRPPAEASASQLHGAAARPAVRALRASKIREVANAGLGRGDIAAFWFGEPDEPTPDFIKRAGIVALREGEPELARGVDRLRAARDFLVDRLRRVAGVDVAPPAATMYAFLRVAGVDDSLAFCKRLVSGAGLGLAPGAAFGPEGEGFVRWCFAASEARLADGVDRLARALASR